MSHFSASVSLVVVVSTSFRLLLETWSSKFLIKFSKQNFQLDVTGSHSLLSHIIYCLTLLVFSLLRSLNIAFNFGHSVDGTFDATSSPSFASFHLEISSIFFYQQKLFLFRLVYIFGTRGSVNTYNESHFHFNFLFFSALEEMIKTQKIGFFACSMK